MRELTTVLASPEVVLAELEHASSSDARSNDLAAAQQVLASLEDRLTAHPHTHSHKLRVDLFPAELK